MTALVDLRFGINATIPFECRPHCLAGTTFDETCQGSVPQARFGMPEDLAQAAWTRLPADMRQVMQSLSAVAKAM